MTLQELKKRKDQLEAMFSDIAIISNPDKIKAVSQEYNEIAKKINIAKKTITNKDNSNKAIVEIRAGTGGDEAALFASELLRMYQLFAEKNNFNIKIINESKTSIGGYKEVTVEINGKEIYSIFKNESGTHRVQRIPGTEKNGRIHTSTATVAVLPVVENVQIDIKPEELDYEIAKSSGPGGQNVNKRMTAVRLIHKPTGIVVISQNERSLEQNKQTALQILKAKLFKVRQEEQDRKLGNERKEQIGTADRSEKIRTYNFPQDRLTDHRINKTWHNLPSIMQGNINDIIKITSQEL
ncbi:MAG: Peptide chain release factor 1 [Parcubacteria group bacterium GW2011_GWA2_31_28]|nr:MAG: Peptide chain release factor 1 [Parcubacteria group bacterium GW2011_GWA2_31_28]